MNKLGINLDAVKEIDCEEFIKYIKELGFRATFTDMTFERNVIEIASLCKKYDIEYSFIHAPYFGTNNLWLKGSEGDQMLQKILSCIDNCAAAEVPTAVVHISSGYTPPPMLKVGKERFKKIVEYAKLKKVNIAFENLRNDKYLTWAMNTFKNESHVGFCWDIGHENCFTEGIEYLKRYGDKLLCTHIHDNMCEKSGDLHILPFDGKINYQKAFENFSSLNYNGTLMLEIFSDNEFYKDVKPLDFLKKAYESIEKIQKITLD